ncbi:MAG: NAD-binding protein [Verrucomicrobiaceae bacterium]|nr:NAD-binding protein [Verrucomicrobiaceae bacterium]
MKSVTIAGGGLSGLALGIALRQHEVPVTIIEAGSYPRHRVCGEFISGVTDEQLQALGIEDCLAHSMRHSTSVWYDFDRPFLRANLPEPARGLSRFAVDAALVERFSALGGRLHDGMRQDRDGEGVVWATGRQKKPSDWMGLKAHVEGLELEAGLEIHFGKDAYVGLTKVEGDHVNICGLFRRNQAIPGGQALIQALHDSLLPGLASRVSNGNLMPGSLKGVNHFCLGWQTHVDPSRACIGDSSAMIPPFTGNGMSMAFQSALVAREHLLNWSLGHQPWDTTVKSLRSALHSTFDRRIRWARVMQSVLMHRPGRLLAGWLIRQHPSTFESLYRRVR